MGLKRLALRAATQVQTSSPSSRGTLDRSPALALLALRTVATPPASYSLFERFDLTSDPSAELSVRVVPSGSLGSRQLSGLKRTCCWRGELVVSWPLWTLGTRDLLQRNSGRYMRGWPQIIIARLPRYLTPPLVRRPGRCRSRRNI
jgi:hypothetical protein